jgi:xanthine/CO dehydrogenase XdhC/CoxF family maturation factor
MTAARRPRPRHQAREEGYVQSQGPERAEDIKLGGRVGLVIGSRSPVEIAVSIAAALIASRRHREEGQRSRRGVAPLA